MTTKLIPPDPKRCQCEHGPGAFAFGPPRKVRCPNKPVYIAIENIGHPDDGQRGSMSLCAKCAAALKREKGEFYATLVEIRCGNCDRYYSLGGSEATGECTLAGKMVRRTTAGRKCFKEETR